MRILQIASGTAVNGAVRYCRLLSERLIQRGHQVTLMVRHDTSWLEPAIDGLDVKFCEMKRSPRDVRSAARWVREQKFDVIHTHMSRGHSFGVLMKWATGVPVVATAHSCSWQLHWPFNDFVIANSEATRVYHQRVNRIARDKIETVYCYSDIGRFLNADPAMGNLRRRQKQVAADDFLVALVGEVTERKGHRFLLEGLPRILAAVPNARVWMLGAANRETRYVQRMRKIQTDNQLYRKVKWLGLRDDVQNYMSGADLCVVPSLEEPLGLVALESLATETPVVASRIGGLPEIVQDGVSGVLVQPGSVNELADAIIELAGDPARRQQMGSAGKAFVKHHFEPEFLTDHVVDIYQRVLERREK